VDGIHRFTGNMGTMSTGFKADVPG